MHRYLLDKRGTTHDVEEQVSHGAVQFIRCYPGPPCLLIAKKSLLRKRSVVSYRGHADVPEGNSSRSLNIW